MGFIRFLSVPLAISMITLGGTNIAIAAKATPEKQIPIPVTRPLPEAEKPSPAPQPEPRPQAAPSAPPKPEDKTPVTQPATKQDGTNKERIYQAACLPLLQKQITGKIIPPIDNGQCQIRSPLELTAINEPVKIQFDQAITTNCSMSVTLSEWATEANALAQKYFNSDIKTIGTGSHYQCRNVNSGSKGRVSEHAFGNALDIMSFEFTNGTTTELAKDWHGDAMQNKFWRELHQKSCSLFMTVLGPDADSAHETNLHLDMGCHGKDCTYRICQ